MLQLFHAMNSPADFLRRILLFLMQIDSTKRFRQKDLKRRASVSLRLRVTIIHMADKFTVGLIQMSCTQRRRRKSFACCRQNSRSGETRRANHLHARTVSRRIFLPHRRCGVVRSGGSDSRARRPNALAQIAKEHKVALVVSLFERRAAGVYHNTCAVLDADGSFPRQIPQDAHSRRSSVLRKILFHARRSGLPEFRHQIRAHRHSDLLGSVVSGRFAADRAERRAGNFLSHQHRLAPERKSANSARRNWMPGAPFSARTPLPTDVYVAVVNRVGLRRQSRRRRSRSGILGKFVRRRSVRPNHCAGRERQGRNSGGGMRSRQRAKTRGATGRSCATAASTPISRS